MFEEKSRVGRQNLIKCNSLVSALTVAMVSGRLTSDYRLKKIEKEDDSSDAWNSDEEEEEESPNMYHLILDEWIQFKGDYDQCTLYLSFRQRFCLLVLKYLHDTHDFKPNEADSMLVDAIALIMEEVDQHHGFPARHTGIGARPRAVTLNFGADFNHGIPEQDSNYDFQQNSQGRQQRGGSNNSNMGYRNPRGQNNQGNQN